MLLPSETSIARSTNRQYASTAVFDGGDLGEHLANHGLVELPPQRFIAETPKKSAATPLSRDAYERRAK
jgi:hypothetical protein